MARIPRFLIPALALATGAGCEPAEAAPNPTTRRPVVAEHVTAASDVDQRTFSGTVRARDRALLSFEVPGRVTAVRVDVGDTFDRGTVLARLEQNTRRVSVGRSRAQVSEAEATLAQAELDFARERELLQGDATTQAAYDSAKARLATARSRLDIAKATLALASEELTDTVLRAPYAGVVAERLVEPSQTVAAGTPALRIQGRDELEVHIDVPENLVGRLQTGSEHRVRISSLDHPQLSATITEIGADAGPGGTYPVHLALTSPPPELRSGASAEVMLSLSGERSDALAIPLTAFLPVDEGQGAVFVLKPDSSGGRDGPPAYVTERREIRVAHLAEDHIVASEGLSPGELIVTRGVGLLRDGQHVTRLGETPDRYGR